MHKLFNQQHNTRALYLLFLHVSVQFRLCHYLAFNIKQNLILNARYWALVGGLLVDCPHLLVVERSYLQLKSFSKLRCKLA